MNGALFRRTAASLRVRLIACAVGLFVWGAMLPLIYSAFGKDLGSIVKDNPFFQQFSNFGGGDVFTLTGSIALGFIHPITLLLMGIVAVGFPGAAVAGERQRGTLEVVLARPVSRRTFYVTLYVAGAAFLAVLMAMELLGGFVSASASGVASEMNAANLPGLWLNGWLLFVAILSIGFAASVSFDRAGPALGITLAFVLVSYFLQIVGSLWPDAAWIQRYSVFDLVRAKQVLEGGLILEHVAVLALIAVVAVAYALIVFPKRDLAAPS
jgi:ABC-2 type transport system permease protein